MWSIFLSIPGAWFPPTQDMSWWCGDHVPSGRLGRRVATRACHCSNDEGNSGGTQNRWCWRSLTLGGRALGFQRLSGNIGIDWIDRNVVMWDNLGNTSCTHHFGRDFSRTIPAPNQGWFGIEMALICWVDILWSNVRNHKILLGKSCVGCMYTLYMYMHTARMQIKDEQDTYTF